MKEIEVKITAEVRQTITVPDETTVSNIENGIVDIYFHPENVSYVNKQDLGVNNFKVEIIEPKHKKEL